MSEIFELSPAEMLETRRQDVIANAIPIQEMVDKVVKEYSEDLDDLMRDLITALTQEEAISTHAVERYYAELTNMLYFVSERIEKLNVYSDLSKAIYKEVYNTDYLNNCAAKDEKGKSLRTVAENTAIAEINSKYESTTSMIYERAYKTLKAKSDAAQEMVSTLKNILKHRIQEEYLSSTLMRNIDGMPKDVEEE